MRDNSKREIKKEGATASEREIKRERKKEKKRERVYTKESQ